MSELERQEEVALAVKVLNFCFHCTFYFTFSFVLLLDFQFLGLCLVTLSLTIEIVIAGLLDGEFTSYDTQTSNFL